MKILFVVTDLDTYDKVPWGLTSDVHFFRKYGNIVKVITKKSIWRFYLDYLFFRPDIIVSTGVLGGVPGFFKKIGLIRKKHVHMWDDYYGEQMGRKWGAWPAYLEMLGILNSDYITTMSKYNQVKAGILGKKVEFIPHGVQPNIKPTKIKLKGKVKIVYTGDLSIYRQSDKMINAVMGLDCELYLFGKLKPEFQKLAQNIKNVHFMGFIPAEEIPSVLKQADILINPADQDSSFKFFEYIRAGRPILAFQGRPGYLLTHRETAYLTNDLAKGIKELVKDKKLRNEIGKGAARLSKEITLTWEQVARKHLELYKRILRHEI
jgi:glycosyltransferase involved in cell wall biosynthesis